MIDEIICGDSIQIMSRMEAKSIPLIIADPPYNIGKAAWDRIPNYLDWCAAWIKAVERVMADNGSLYIFHSEMPVIAKLMAWIEDNTDLIYKQLITWDKWYNEFRYGNDLQGAFWKIVNNPALRDYPQMAEYILFYTFQDETGLSRVYDDRDCFRGIKEYLRAERKKAQLSYPDVNKLLGTAEGSGQPGHYFSDSQWCLPTAEMYAKLQTTGFFQRPYLTIDDEHKKLKHEYEGLRNEYEGLRYTFKPRGQTSVWHIPISGSAERCDHPTQKPEALISNIILHSSNEGDLILDPFSGVGTTAIAAMKTSRRYLCIEKEQSYVDIARERIRIEQSQLKLDLGI